jgi:type IV secretion system protein VirB1
MSGFPVAALMALASACAPDMDAPRLADYAMVESGGNPRAINLNGAGGGEQHASSLDDAIAIATRLIGAGRSVDLGLMQLNSAHLGAPGMPRTVAEALEPCRNVAAGAAVLASADRQAACIYNTGRPGCSNGYPDRIAAAAARRRNTIAVSAAFPPVKPAAQPTPFDPLMRRARGRDLVFNVKGPSR